MGKGIKLWMTTFLLLAGAFAAPAIHASDEAEKDRVIAQLMERLAALEAKVASLEAQQNGTHAQLVRVDESLQQAQEEMKSNADSSGAGEEGWYNRLSFHGYGEVHYNAAEGKNGVLDAHRLVLGWTYQFNDRWLFSAELDFEHSFSEPELEFAYVEGQLTDHLAMRAGSLLMPFGSLNETHEPPLFYSVERPYTEKFIIPTTWQETGVGLVGQHGGLSWKAYLVSGLDPTRGSAGKLGSEGVRSFRSGSVESDAEGLAVVADVRYAWNNGFMAGASLYTGSGDHGEASLDGVDITMTAIYGRWQGHGWDLRGEYTWTDIDDADKVSTFFAAAANKGLGSEIRGGYLEAAFDWLSLADSRHRLVHFVRYETFDTHASVPAGWIDNPAYDREIWTTGVAWYPAFLDNLTFKFDWEHWSDAAGGDADNWNLGVGWMF